MLVFSPRNKAPQPETNGALNEVPHPAAYVLYGYVLTMASPGAATHTIAFPQFENDDRVLSVAVVEPTDATPITTLCSAAGKTASCIPSSRADEPQMVPSPFA